MGKNNNGLPSFQIVNWEFLQLMANNKSNFLSIIKGGK